MQLHLQDFDFRSQRIVLFQQSTKGADSIFIHHSFARKQTNRKQRENTKRVSRRKANRNEELQKAMTRKAEHEGKEKARRKGRKGAKQRRRAGRGKKKQGKSLSVMIRKTNRNEKNKTQQEVQEAQTCHQTFISNEFATLCELQSRESFAIIFFSRTHIGDHESHAVPSQ